MRVIILGAGGQGQVLADEAIFVIEEDRDINITEFLDNDSSLLHKEYI